MKKTLSSKSSAPQFGAVKTNSFFSSPAIHSVIIVIIAFLIYSNTLNAPFDFDDELNITDNSKIKNINNFWPPAGTRWVGFLIFAVNYYFGHINPFGYHIVNLLIHIINALLVYWLVTLTLKTPFIISAIRDKKDIEYKSAFFASLLFVCHPIQTQAVTYIVQRFASLATLFYLLSLVMYIRARLEAKFFSAPALFFYFFSLVSAVLAMKTKEIAFTLPVVMFIYELMFLGKDMKKRLLYLAPFMLTMLIIPLTLIGSEGSLADIRGIDEAAEKMSESKDIPRLHYLYTQFSVIITYIRLFFLPVNQNIDYDYPVYDSFFRSGIFIPFLFLLAILIMGAYLYWLSQKSEMRDRHWLRLCCFGIFWFFVTLSVESSVIPIKDVIFEHRAYLPSAGFFITFISIIGLVGRKWGDRNVYAKKIISFMMALIVVALSMVAYARNGVWKDSVSLWENSVKGSPNKARPHNNLGIAYFKQGRINEAIDEFKTSLRLSPQYANAHYNLGIAFASQGRFDEAVSEYKIALRLKPDDADARNNLGLAYYYQNRIDEAVSELKAAIKLNPEYVAAHTNLGIAYLKQGRFYEAISEFKTALKFNPDFAEAHINLGLAYFYQNRVDEAVNELRIGLRLNPDFAEGHNNLGLACLKQGNLDEAVSEFKIALKLKPEYANAHYNLGKAYSKQGRFNEAVSEYKTALKLRPDNAAARKDLEALYKEMNKTGR